MPRNLILGTAGHIDHGKTSLVKALTGVDTDRLPEEKARGITIDIGFASLDLGDFRLGIVDVPGHERFIKNMLAGATGVDLAVLVVAADDSVMPQTREHLEILRHLGLKHGVVALTKCDLVDADTRGPSEHVLDEALMPGDIHDAELVIAQLERGKADVDGDAAGLLFRQTVAVDAGQRLDQRRLAVVDVPGSSKDQVTRHEHSSPSDEVSSILTDGCHAWHPAG